MTSAPQNASAGRGGTKHRPDIDGLRAVAVIPVLLFHFGVGQIPGGFTGVDIFFVISGFVIANSITADIAVGRFTIRAFYDRRIRRIFPALVATLIATTVMAWLTLLPSDLVDYADSLIATSLFGSNIYFWKTANYFAAAAQNKPLLHTWSLAVEEQFYIFVPVAFLLTARLARGRYLAFAVPALIVSFAIAVAAIFVGPTAGFFLLPTRAWELLCGTVLALACRPAPATAAGRQVVAAAGLALIVAGMTMLTEQDPFPGWNAMLPCLGAVLIIHAGSGGDGVAALPAVNRLLATRPFTAIGAISYSLYLVHWPIAAFTRYRTLAAPTPWGAAAMMAASLVLAAVSWRYIEQPLRRAPTWRRSHTLTAGIAIIVLFAGIGAVLRVTDGAPGRFPTFAERSIPGIERWGDTRCFHLDPSRPIDWNAAHCTRVRGPGGRILLWGDSFAAQYVPGILDDAGAIGADVLQYTFAGCPPILAYYSYARTGCSRSNARVPDIVRRERITTVVIAGRWPDTPRHTLARLHETVAALRALGVRVVVFGPSPEFAADVQHLDFLNGLYRRQGIIRWPSSLDPSLGQMVAREATGAEYVDPQQFLCSGLLCPYRLGTTYLFADYDHFSAAGSLRAVRAYFPKTAAISAHRARK